MALKAGDRFRVPHRFSQSDFDRFAALTGDDNPIHVDPVYAVRMPFGGTVAHGMLLYSMIRRFLEERLPAHREIEQELRFEAPTYSDELVDFEMEIAEVGGGFITVRTDIRKPDGRYGCRGTARLWTVNGAEPPVLGLEPGQLSMDTAGSLESLRLGQHVEIAHTFSRQDLSAWRSLIGGRAASFDDVPGPLLGGMISTLLGTRLPGPGTNWLKQHYRYLQEVRPGEPIRARVEIVRLRPEKGLVNLSTVCVNGVGETVCDGAALVLYRNAYADAN